MKDSNDANEDRKAWLSLMAKAPIGRVAELLDEVIKRPDFNWLRAPEIGSFMVRGRAGGTGAPFNLGEMTVTRCSLKLESGETGHGYVQGRRKACAEATALCDALMQGPSAEAVRSGVLDKLAEERIAAKQKRAGKAASTKVDFFTVARGED